MDCIYLPTANGPMPVAALINGNLDAVHSDHLNTPRRLTDANGQVVWQWSYSAFGDDEPTTAKNRCANLCIRPNPGSTGIVDVAYNIGFMGMYRDPEIKYASASLSGVETQMEDLFAAGRSDPMLARHRLPIRFKVTIGHD